MAFTYQTSELQNFIQPSQFLEELELTFVILHEIFDVIERVAKIVEIEEGLVRSGSGVDLIGVFHELRQFQIVLQLLLRCLRGGKERIYQSLLK